MNGGRFDFDDGGSYCGGWEEGKAHGHGVCTGPKGKGEYCGSWHYGFEVTGVYTWPSGNTYEGHWEHGRRHGLGVENKGRWVYRGEWTQGYKGKYGVIQSLASGARYEGTWSSGLQDGYGQETYADGGIYQGQWVGGMRHGCGIRNSVPFGMASIVRPSLRTSLTSLRSEHENGSIASVPDNFGQRGGFVLDVSDDGTTDTESRSGTMKRGDATRMSKALIGLRTKRGKRDKNGSGGHKDSSDSAGGSLASFRPKLNHQDSLKSTESESRMSSSSLQSSVMESDFSHPSHLMEEEATGDITEVFLGEWKQDKRSGVGISQRSDNFQYAGEWHQNKRHGYGCLTYPDGHKEEGKWKNNILVASGKKKLFVIGSKRISDRVERAVEAANQAANIARQKADLAISRASYAREKAEMAETAASESREEASKARQRAKELTASLPPRGNVSRLAGFGCRTANVRFANSLSPDGGTGDIKLDRKKSFFGRHLGGFDRKSHMRGTIIEAKQEPSFQTPTHSADNKSHPSRLVNEWDGRGSNPTYESSAMRESHSTGNLFDGSPVPRRRVQSSDHPSNGGQASFHPRNQHGDVGVRFNGYQDSEYSASEGYYDDRHHRMLPDRRYVGERGSAELTPDSGISTTSDSDRLRRAVSDRKRTLAKRQLSRQEGVEEDSYDRHLGPSQGHSRSHYDEYDSFNVDELEEDLMSQAAYASARFDEEGEQEKLRQQRQKQKSKFSKEVTLISDMPPGHVRTFDGKFPARCKIRYLPKANSRDEDWTDPDLDAEGALAIQAGKVQSWSASRSLVLLVLILNIGFAVLFTNLFLQMEEEEDNWEGWP
ncbi:junctophilin-3-like isoform X3 [Acanthaster planci]|uniref:Junctophilin-3-like isoform X3 n=1 Tax=Acanthaster planci TaxID=133434 RepID=A0A8B7XVZ5_ACAPL|nr:junctophilin-3-like isoform X3 [Acanthaster planci]